MYGIPLRWVKIYSSVILISLISKFTGLVRDALITSHFGATMVTDSYVIALLVPEVLFNLFGNSLTTNFSPIFFEAERANRQKRFVAGLFCVYLALAGIIYVVGLNYSGWFVLLFAPGFRDLAFATTKMLMQIFFLNIFFITLTYFCLAFLQTHKRFLIPSSIGVVYNLVIASALLLVPSKTNLLNVLIAATLAGYFCQFLIQLPQARSEGLPMPSFTVTPELKRYFVLSIPVAFLAILGQLNIAMDNYFASRLGEGSITTLNLGYRLLMGIYSLLITNTMMIVYPVLSRNVVQNNWRRAGEIVQKTTNWLLILLVPIAAFLFYSADPIIDLLFCRGAFSPAQSDLTGLVFRGYIVGLFFYAFRDLLIRNLFAEHSAWTPMLNGILNSSLNFLYLLALVPLLGLPGVSLATALSAVSSSFVLFLYARKTVPSFARLRFFRLAVVISAASVAGVAGLTALKPVINSVFQGTGLLGRLAGLGVQLAIFCLFYTGVCLLWYRRKIIWPEIR